MAEPHTAARVLIVDDDAGLRESMELVLATDGYRVVSADNGELCS